MTSRVSGNGGTNASKPNDQNVENEQHSQAQLRHTQQVRGQTKARIRRHNKLLHDAQVAFYRGRRYAAAARSARLTAAHHKLLHKLGKHREEKEAVHTSHTHGIHGHLHHVHDGQPRHEDHSRDRQGKQQHGEGQDGQSDHRDGRSRKRWKATRVERASAGKAELSGHLQSIAGEYHASPELQQRLMDAHLSAVRRAAKTPTTRLLVALQGLLLASPVALKRRVSQIQALRATAMSVRHGNPSAGTATVDLLDQQIDATLAIQRWSIEFPEEKWTLERVRQCLTDGMEEAKLPEG